MGIGFARLGDKAEALAWLEQALRRHVADLPSIRWDPAVDGLRGEARFRAMLDAIYGAGGAR